MRLIVDESTGAAVVEFLRNEGHDVLSVDESMPQASDADILACSSNEARMVITNDKDFGELVFRSGHPHHGVLLLRLRDESAANRVRVVQAVLGQWANRLAGSFVLATDWRVRFRRTGNHVRPPE